MENFILKLLVLLLLISSNIMGEVKVAIQPLGDFDSTLYPDIIASIQETYPDCSVDILPTLPVPESAYYEPRNRYRAEKILEYLDIVMPPEYDKVVGVLEKDISTTKGEYIDWGIFGLGEMSDNACVVSVFRLRRGGVSNVLYTERLCKTVIHELGHTFGLEHCEITGCIMADAQGRIATFDYADEAVCDHCRSHLDIVFMLL